MRRAHCPPPLPSEEMRILLRRMSARGIAREESRRLRNAALLHRMRFAATRAGTMCLSRDDIRNCLHEGAEGLREAIDWHQPDRGATLTTCAARRTL